MNRYQIETELRDRMVTALEHDANREFDRVYRSRSLLDRAMRRKHRVPFSREFTPCVVYDLIDQLGVNQNRLRYKAVAYADRYKLPQNHPRSKLLIGIYRDA